MSGISLQDRGRRVEDGGGNRGMREDKFAVGGLQFAAGSSELLSTDGCQLPTHQSPV